MVSGDDVTKVPDAELIAFLKISVGACWPGCPPVIFMFPPCIIACCCCPGCVSWFACIGESVIVPFWTGALDNVTRLLFIVTIVDVCVLLLVGYTNFTGSFFGIFVEFRAGCCSGWCWPATKFEKICWWLTIDCWWMKWLLFIVDVRLLFDSIGFVKFALFADNEDATRKTGDWN